MKCGEIAPLLVELNEGTISPENQKLVERHAALCVRCAENLALIGKAFESLRISGNEEVPTHYFTSLLPRIRRRLVERRSEKFGFVLPGWAERFLAPVAALGVVACMVALYGLLNPVVETTESHLMQLVSQFPKEEMEGVADLANYSPVLARTTELHRGMLETLPNPSLVSLHIERQLVDDEVNHGHRLSTFLTAGISFEDINDDEVDSIIDRLKDVAL